MILKVKLFLSAACCILIFSNCFNSSSKKETTKVISDEEYLEQGQKIAMMTFSTLSSNLQKAMKEGGVSHAVKYCNIAASPLVDSLEQVYQATIKRTSLKIRNPKNQANQDERKQLESYQQKHDSGTTLKPVLQKSGDNITFYAPIHLMELCGKCHGTIGEKLSPEDYLTVQELYPSDNAINYKTGDLRGMWSISFRGK